MKTAKLVIGIISMVLFVLVAFQSCAAGLGNALADNGEVSGTSGMLLAFCMLIAGIVGVATRPLFHFRSCLYFGLLENEESR